MNVISYHGGHKINYNYAVKFKEHVTFLCIDDKAKVDIGEPNQYISTGVRGKKTLVPTGSQLSALDHDVSSKGSITPSVSLRVNISDEPDGSFYKGQVFVTYKDSVFQPSSPVRHVAELQSMLKAEGDVSPVLMIFSDGGPDHRLTYHSVKLTLIILFKNLDLDMLIAGRTAPGHSWLNPVERVMATLNLALQNTSLARTESSADIEQILKGANSMSEIRKKSERVPALKEAWLASVSSVVDTIRNRTERLTLKGTPFKCLDPASEQEVQMVESQFHDIDQTIELGKYQTKDLKTKIDYQDFLTTHCIQHQYLFQIMKCENADCCRPKRCSEVLPIMPDPILAADKEHYQPFVQVLGKKTSDSDRPSSSNQTVAAVAEEIQGCPNRVLTGQNVRLSLKCFECSKPRCIYSKKALTAKESRSLEKLIETQQYSCGSLLTPEGDVLHGVIFVRMQVDCNTPVEYAYYSSASGHTRKDICCHCGEENIQRDKELVKSFKIVLPVCQSCLNRGETPLTRNPIKN